MNNNLKGDYNSKIITPEEVILGIEATKGPLTEEQKKVVRDRINEENKKVGTKTVKNTEFSLDEIVEKIEANTGKVLTEEQRRIVRDKVKAEAAITVPKKPSDVSFIDISNPTVKEEKKVGNRTALTAEEVIKEIEKNKGIVLTEGQRRIVIDKLNFENNNRKEPTKKDTDVVVEDIISPEALNTELTSTVEKPENDIDNIVAVKPDFIENSPSHFNKFLTDEDINGLASALDKSNTEAVSSQVKEMIKVKVTPEEVIEQIENSNGIILPEELRKIVRDKVNMEIGISSVANKNLEMENIKSAIYNKIGELQDFDDDDEDNDEELNELYQACEILAKVGLEFSIPQKALLEDMGVDTEKALGPTKETTNDIRYYYGKDKIYDQFGNEINIFENLED